MTIYNTPFPNLQHPCVVALGTFDGVHIGHAAVITAAVGKARTLSARTPAAVWCFTQPPKSDKALTTPDEKANLIAALGADELIMIPPAPELLSLSPEQFADALITSLCPLHVVVGYNYTYGKGAAGTPDTLREYLARHGIGLSVIPPVEYGGVPVSSTAIRRLIAAGDTAAASDLLGRPIK